MKKYIYVALLVLSTYANAEITITEEWANLHPNATQILQRINNEQRRADNDYAGKLISSDDYQKINKDLKKQTKHLESMLTDNDGKDINREQNVYLNGQNNLIYNETIQDVNNH